MPKAIDICWGKQYTNQEALEEKLGNEMSVRAVKSSDAFLGLCLATYMPRAVHMLGGDLKKP